MPMPMYPMYDPVSMGVYMVPHAGMSGIFALLMIFAVIFFILPIILFFVMMYKARRNVAVWHGIFTSNDVKKQMERSNERVNGFVDKIDELFDLWIERERKKK